MTCKDRVMAILEKWRLQGNADFEMLGRNSVQLLENRFGSDNFTQIIDIYGSITRIELTVHLFNPLIGTIENVSLARKRLLNLNQDTPVKFKEASTDQGAASQLDHIGVSIGFECVANIKQLEEILSKNITLLSETLEARYDDLYEYFCAELHLRESKDE